MFHLDTTETGLELSVCRPCTWSALSSTLSLHELGKCEWTVLTEKNTVQLNDCQELVGKWNNVLNPGNKLVKK